MFNRNNSNPLSYAPSREQESSVALRPLMRLVYMWMGLGLLTTALLSFFVASNENIVAVAANWYLPLVILQVVVVIALGWMMQRVSPTVAGGLFFFYSALNGVTFGVIFFGLVATGQSMAITNAFLTTAGLFGAMTVVGYTTKVDLSKFSTFFMMALIGLMIAIVVNIFLGSTMLDFIISVFGVLLFTGLTAWDTQRIKNLAAMPEYQEHSDDMAKLAIMGALMLYLDFINLFIFLLRLFAGGRD
jgi:uncharacterized protein